MKDLKHISQAKKKTFTFLLIPNSSGKVIKFSLPYWLLLTTIICTAVMLITALGFYGTFINTAHKLHLTQQNNDLLAETNQVQADEINFFQNRTMEIEQKLAGLNELEDEVLNMVGLPPKNRKGSNEQVSQVSQVSRSAQRPLLNNRQADYKGEIARLDLLIDQGQDDMQQLIEQVERRLEFLDSLPDIMPATGQISSGFGNRKSPFNSRRLEFHSGIDIANRSGTNIFAAGSGIVTFSGYSGAYGLMIIISHGNGYESVYGHNSKNLVKKGDKVSKRDLIAKMGSSGRSTGSHVHFEVRLNGKPIDPATVK